MTESIAMQKNHLSHFEIQILRFQHELKRLKTVTCYWSDEMQTLIFRKSGRTVTRRSRPINGVEIGSYTVGCENDFENDLLETMNNQNIS